MAIRQKLTVLSIPEEIQMLYIDEVRDMCSDLVSRHVSFGNKVLTLGILLLQLVAVYIVCAVVYTVVNEAGIDTVKSAHVTVEKMGSTTHSLSGPTSTGRSKVFMTWPSTPRSIRMVIDGQLVHEFVNKSVYKTLDVGSVVYVTYGYGRLDGSIVVLAVKPV